jgi:hypothetical protein
VAVIALAFPAFFHLIAWGQTSALALACFTAMFFLLRDRREFLAGLVLGCLIFKPQLGLAAAVVFVSTGTWKAVLGGCLSAAAQLALGIFYFGKEPLEHWIKMLRNVTALLPLLEPKPYQTYCLRTFWSMLIPWSPLASILYILGTIVVLGLTIAIWRRVPPASLTLRHSSLLIATVLVSPHLTIYDLVLLAPAFLLMAGWLVDQPPSPFAGWLGTLLYLAYMLPLLGLLTQWTHVQLSVVAMTAWLYLIWRVGGQDNPAPIRSGTA